MLRKNISLRLLLVLSAFCLVCPAVWAADDYQSQGVSSEKEKSVAQSLALEEAASKSQASPAKAAKEKTVTDIEITGNKSISSNTVISKMKTRIGSPYQENIVSDDLKRLYLLGFFSDIKVDTQEYKDGVKVVISVTERPVIDKITFSGMKRLVMKEEKMKELLKSKEAQYLDYPNLTGDISAIKNLYEKKGFGQVQVDYQVSTDPQTNKANIRFTIAEGLRVKIQNIFVEGNNAFPDSRILKLIKTKRAWLFNAGALKDEVFKEDLERIKAFYRREGFNDAAVDYETKSHALKPIIFITIKIQEGRKYLVGSLAVKGSADIRENEILSKVKKCVPGAVFSQESVKEDISAIQGLYFDRGYISCQVQETTFLNPNTDRIDITYIITENQVSYVDKIKIKGNVKTKDIVVRREMRLRPGDRFDGEKLRRSKERLQNLGFFEEIGYDTEDTQVSDKKDLIVDVKEAKTGSFSFGGGYSSVDKLVGFVEVEQKNFDWKNFPYFTGDGQNLKLRASLGSVSEGYDLSFTEPWVFDYPVSFGFDAYKRKHDREEDTGYGYNEDVTGADVRLGKELTEFWRSNATYRFDVVKIGDVPTDASEDLRAEEGENSISSLEFGLSFDNRNNVFEPSKGIFFNNALTCAGGPAGGDKDFIKFYNRTSYYVPLFKGSVLEFRGRAGWADPYRDTAKVPIYERFFAGGANTIRGYHERAIGPVDSSTNDALGGESLLVGNVEYTYPILSFIRIAAFYDVGNVWAKANDFAGGNLYSGTGVGIRVKTPIGPLMLDYGIPMDKEPGEDTKGSGMLHFSMSHGF
jgi:outer membrane protein insertion porin family